MAGLSNKDFAQVDSQLYSAPFALCEAYDFAVAAAAAALSTASFVLPVFSFSCCFRRLN